MAQSSKKCSPYISHQSSVSLNIWLEFDTILEARFQDDIKSGAKNSGASVFTFLIFSTLFFVCYGIFQWLSGQFSFITLSPRIVIALISISGKLYILYAPCYDPWHIHFWMSCIVPFIVARMFFFSDAFLVIVVYAPLVRLVSITSGIRNMRKLLVFQVLDFIVLVSACVAYGTTFSQFQVMVTLANSFGIAFFVAYKFEKTDRLRWWSESCLQASLQAECLKAESADRMLNFVSHEVRNPQNAIALSIESLLIEADQNRHIFRPEHRRIFEVIHNSSEFVTALLEDVLNYQRLHGGKVILDLKPFSPLLFLTRLSQSLAVVSNELNFLTDFDPTMPEVVIGDKHRVQQVISNFVSNAAKFTPANGTVTLVARMVASKIHSSPMLAQSNTTLIRPYELSTVMHETLAVLAPLPIARIRFSVVDTGVGISEADQALLFRPFSQVNASELQGGKGMGLGLNICKGLVELHGGVIGVVSSPGKGSEFFFELPFAIPTDTGAVIRSEPCRDSVLMESSSTLISTPTAQSYISILSEPARVVPPRRSLALHTDPELSISSAATSFAVTPLAASVLHGSTITLSITPCGSPVPDENSPKLVGRADVNLGATRSLQNMRPSSPPRVSGVFNRDIPSKRQSGGRSKTHNLLRAVRFAAGHSTLASPQLGNVTIYSSGLHDVRLPAASSVTGVDVEAVSGVARVRILVADDNAFMRVVLGRLLLQLGYNCDFVENGVEFVKRLSEPDHGFSVAICDMIMPLLNGVGAIQAVRKLGLKIPVLGLTGDATEAARDEFLAAGAQLVLAKPVQLDGLRNALSEPLNASIPTTVRSAPETTDQTTNKTTDTGTDDFTTMRHRNLIRKY